MKVALLVIDVQKDFCEGGLLAARDTRTLIAPLNQAISAATRAGVPVLLTRDWHPPDHGSFVAQGGPWPPHCVQGTEGASFAAGLNLQASACILNKGVSPDDDGYSMFVGTQLRDWLQRLQVDTVVVCGIATEYCVLESVRDALKNRFKVILLEDLVRPIERVAGDSARAISEMQGSGAQVLSAHDWLANLQSV